MNWHGSASVLPGWLSAGSGGISGKPGVPSSVIGLVKFMERYGLSAHQAAALALARRLLGCREGIPRRRTTPLDNGGHVDLQRTREEARDRMCGRTGGHSHRCLEGPACLPQASIGSIGETVRPILFWLVGPGRTCSMLIAG